ncbi:hypothetical protein [Brevibacillus dissolubilis]|uniref:hypothetical protein n=1 Tax=Brevibacillus dissolubilis TaxID=1844116 RepID=UPI0011179EA5|nr:hypothetical protein [Brevibacillus dissolubilis]
MAVTQARISVDPKAPDSLMSGALKINGNFDKTDAELESHHNQITSLGTRLVNTERNLIDALIELETMKNAELNGVNSNILIETFRDLDEVTMHHGVFAQIQGKIILR